VLAAMDGWTMMDIFLGMMDFKDDGYFFFDVGQIFVQDEHKSKNDRRISEDVEQSHGFLKNFLRMLNHPIEMSDNPSLGRQKRLNVVPRIGDSSEQRAREISVSHSHISASNIRGPLASPVDHRRPPGTPITLHFIQSPHGPPQW
jgi:hypothetical protein